MGFAEKVVRWQRRHGRTSLPWQGTRDPYRIWLAERMLPKKAIEPYTQGLMDLGATICTRARPSCERCPVTDACRARKEGRIAELPPPRERRELPQKEVTWLLLRHNGAVRLERRP